MLSDKAKEALRNAMADKDLANEVIAELEALVVVDEAQSAINDDFESRIAALEAV
jgi:hypothetical protein